MGWRGKKVDPREQKKKAITKEKLLNFYSDTYYLIYSIHFLTWKTKIWDFVEFYTLWMHFLVFYLKQIAQSILLRLKGKRYKNPKSCFDVQNKSMQLTELNHISHEFVLSRKSSAVTSISILLICLRSFILFFFSYSLA